MHKFIDTHAHIDDKKFDDDRDQVIEEIKEKGVMAIIDPAVNMRSCKKVLELSEKHEIIYPAFGIHPHDAKDMKDNDLVIIEEMLKNKKAVAVGEIGLDYHYDFSPRERQIEVFRDFLKLAKKINKPVIIHNRESDEDMVAILESEMTDYLKGQFHCFSGDLNLLTRVLEMGFYVSFTGSVTFPKNNYAEIVERTPLDRILLETDSPYMAPHPYRGRRCDSGMIPFIVKRIAEIKKIEEDLIYKYAYENSVRLFSVLKI